MGAPDGQSEPAYVEHPLLAPETVERRLYQLRLAETAMGDHTLVTLPTGLGKTTVTLLVTAHRLEDVGGKILLLAPTKPLVQQHADFYRDALEVPEEEIVVFTGEVRPGDRAALWDDATVVIATPQVVENDLIGGRISLGDVTHLTFDECHRATGDYAYGYIAERYHAEAEDPLVTGLSASPGGDAESILGICDNLGLRDVEVLTEEDSDVARYAHDTQVEWERISLPDEVLEIRDCLNDVITDRLTRLKEAGVIQKTSPDISQRELNRVRGRLQQLIDAGKSEGYQGMSVHAEVMKLRRAVELVETQSVESARRYFERQRNQADASGASKASQRLVSEPKVQKAMRLADEFDDLHPKFRRARMLLAETLGIDGGERVIVFTESRDTAETLTDFLGDHFETRRFVGQGDRDGSDGMTQTEQQETLDAFRAGEFQVLVSTSVAEEGLDVPEVDLVLFYEPVPTAIRSIQRKGRTGRQAEGRVVVLLAEDTRDEAYFWKAQNEEDRMAEELRELQDVAEEVRDELETASLSAFVPDGPDGAEAVAGDRTDHETAFDATRSTESSDGAGVASSETDDERPSPRTATDGKGPDGTSAGQIGLADFGGPDHGDGSEADGESRDASDAASEPEPASVVRPDPAAGDIEVVVDQRELDSTIGRDLSTRDDLGVRLETLAVGDYVLSDRVAAERKTVADFLDSLLAEEDRSLFEQVRDLARHYDRPVILVEGEGDLYAERNVHPNAIRGALASLAVDFGASVLRTKDETDTAELLAVIATREQTVGGREVSAHGEKARKTLPEQQEYVVSSIADIGPVTARTLLEELGSVEAVMTADNETLTDVSGVGDVTAERIREVVGSPYEP